MPLFLCDKCGVIENTALSAYWSKDQLLDGAALCSECTHIKFSDGDEQYGKWHGKFPREFMTDEQIANKTDWSGWMYCLRLDDVLSAYHSRQMEERKAREEQHYKATEPEYPPHINNMPCRSRSERRAKQQAKAKFKGMVET